MTNPKTKKDKTEAPLAGVATYESAQLYGENVLFHASRGHGFAAEKANHLHDVFTGQQARHDGSDFRRHGADRVVNNVQIQTKYCKEGAKCIAECFGKNKEFVYWTEDGAPMQIEVPLDCWEDAVKAMADRIKKGQVVLRKNGKVQAAVTDPADATRLVRRGHYKYDTVLSIAKAGTVECLMFDAVNGIQVAGSAAGASAVVSYAVAIWNGEDAGKALEAACYTGLKVGGIAWLSSVATSQLGRTGIEQALRPATKALVARMGPDAARWLAAGTGKDLAGAAAKNYMSKLMRGNIVAATATTIVLSAGDLFSMFGGRISFAQLFKNVASTAAGVAGGMSGATAGAAQGAAWGSFIPGLGNVFGGIIGGIVGGLAGGSAAQGSVRFVLDGLIEDDAKQMLRILQEVFSKEAVGYLVNQDEAKAILSVLESHDLPSTFRDMYASDNHYAFAKQLLRPIIEEVLAKRIKVRFPSDDDVLEGVERMLSKSVSDTDVATPTVYNEERSMSIEIPTIWKRVGDASNPRGFPQYTLSKGSIVANCHAISLGMIPMSTITDFYRDYYKKKFPDSVISEVSEVIIGAKHASQFRFAAADKDGTQRFHMVIYVREALCSMMFTLMSVSEGRIEADWEEIESWIGSLAVHKVDATLQKHDTLIVDEDDLLHMVLPDGWRQVEFPENEKNPTKIFKLDCNLPINAEVFAMEPKEGISLSDMATIFGDEITKQRPETIYSLSAQLINGREAVICHAVAEHDLGSLHHVYTVMQFDGYVVVVLCTILTDDLRPYRDQCEALAWRVFPGAAENCKPALA